MIVKGQSDYTAWFRFRKGTITASKSHELKTKMEKFDKGGGYVKMWSLCQKTSGLTNITSALKYVRNMEQQASNAFFEAFKCSHKKPRLSYCGLFLKDERPSIGASPDGILKCACHGRAWLDIKCPF